MSHEKSRRRALYIDRVETWIAVLSLPSPVTDAISPLGKTGRVGCRIWTNDGASGIGWTYLHNENAICSVIQDSIAPVLLGNDPLGTEELWNKMFWALRYEGTKGLAFRALSAVDIALWDLKGHILGLPIYSLLGGSRRAIPIYASGGWTSYTAEQLVDEAMAKDRLVGLVAYKNTDPKGSYEPANLYDVGTAALILKMSKPDERGTQLLVQGAGRFRILEYLSDKPYLRARIETVPEQTIKDMEADAMMSNLVGL